MKLKTLLPILLLTSSLFAQKKKHIVTLEIEETIENVNFEIDSIIDNRIIKDNIGYAQKGAFNKKVVAIFPDSLNIYLSEKLKKLIPEKAEARKLSLIIHQLVISEQTKATSEAGICRTQIEFVENIKSANPKSFGTYNSEIITKGRDVTKKHGKRIVTAISECINELEYDKWSQMTGKPYINNEVIEYDYTKIPSKGTYPTFYDLSSSQPESSSYIFDEKGSKKYPKYYLKDKDGRRIRKRNLAISDGENIYLHASFYSYDSHYVKSKHIGKYIYFEDRVSDPLAAAAFGLIGALASNIPHGIVLDTSTGLVFSLTEKNIQPILEKYPEIYSKYKKTLKNLKDKEIAIVSINNIEAKKD